MSSAVQPTYDFLTGADASPTPKQTFRETLKQTSANLLGPEGDSEGLRAQYNALQYELEELKEERELTKLQHQSELRDALNRADVDFKRAQAAEGVAAATKTKLDQLQSYCQDVQDRSENEKLAMDKRIRSLQDDNRSLREEVEDAQAALSSRERAVKYAEGELERRNATLQASVDELQQNLNIKVNALHSTQQRLAQKEAEFSEVENEMLRLKVQTGDSDTLALIKKELSEQVAHIKELEATNREQLAEVRQFRKIQKNVEVVEEEKRALETKTRLMDDLRQELAETQLQRRILEDEKRSWTSYLKTEGESDENMQYETPEQMARAFLQERLERLRLVDKLGSIQPQLSVKDENIRSLQDEKAKLQAELEKSRTPVPGAPIGDGKAKARLERQRNLALKEVEYLRAQMKAFEAEETELTPEHVDQEHLERIHSLEGIVEQYRAEVQSLHTDLAKAEVEPPKPSSPRKRSREEDGGSDERVGELRRKARALSKEIEQLQIRNQVLEADGRANVLQIAALKESARTRVLELKDNPTARFEAIKQSTLITLREENKALLGQLEGRPPGTKVVPISTLDNVRLQLDDLQGQLKQRDIKADRLKKIWGTKSLEFREAVASIMGWKFDFMPNGRVKVTSILYPSLVNADGEEEENSIVFDGEQGTMKVSGGPQSIFAGEIRHLIEFWVEGRKEIPAFLAACTLEFYDKTTRAAHA